MMKYILSILLGLLLISSAHAAISGATVVTNYSSSDRVPVSVNYTINISFTESMGTNYTNISFPADFNLTSLVITDITNNSGTDILTTSGNNVNMSYVARASGGHYYNFTTNVRTPSSSGTQAITIMTNATTSATTVNLCTRNTSRPHLISGNNSNYVLTCGTPTETFGQDTTTVILSGRGATNLTFYTANITGETNITVGWGATNASLLKATYVGTLNGITNVNMVFVTTLATVTNPTITVAKVTEFKSSNLPYVVATGGVVTVLIVVYLRRRLRIQ